MKIDKLKLIGVLEKVSPGLAQKDIVEQAKHFVFTGDDILTYNDRLCIIHPFTTDFACSVPADQFYKIMNKLPDGEIEISETEKGLAIKAGKTKASIQTQEGEKILDYVKKLDIDSIKKWKSLPKDFIEGLTMCMFSASTDMTDARLTGLFVDYDAVSSTDDLRMSQYVFESDIKETFNIPASSVKELIKFPVVKFAVKGGWVHFITEDDVSFSSNLLVGDFPKLDKFFELEGTKIELPEDFTKSVDTAMIMARGEVDADHLIDIEITKNSIRCRGENDYGWIENEIEVSSKVKDIRFTINPAFLIKILSHTRKMVCGSGRALFKAKNFHHVMAIKE